MVFLTNLEWGPRNLKTDKVRMQRSFRFSATPTDNSNELRTDANADTHSSRLSLK
jgi:hypothetical protein